MAPARRRSLTDRLRGMFQAGRNPSSRPRSRLQTQDYDDVPQRHMMETQREIARASSVAPHQHLEKGAASGGRAGAGVTRQRGHAASHRKPPGPSDRPEAAAGPVPAEESPCACGTLPMWGDHLPPVSPLEMFYHTFVAQYDTRVARPAARGGLTAQDEGKERNAPLRPGMQLCPRKSSRDNTIGSIDSIHSEDVLAHEKKDLVDEDSILLPNEVIEARERQFLADAVKRVGKDADMRGLHHCRPDQRVPYEPLCNVKKLFGNGEDGAMDRRDSKPKAVIHIPQMGEIIVAEGLGGHESNSAMKEALCAREFMEESMVSPTSTALAMGSSAPSAEALTLSLSARGEDKTDGLEAAEGDNTCISDGLNMSAQIDNALINMKRRQERLKVCGKFSQVIVVHGDGSRLARKSSGPRPGTSTQEDYAQVRRRDFTKHKEQDVVAHMGRHASFNICGENVYVTLGSAKTKIKSCRRKNIVRAHSAGVDSKEGASGGKKKGGGSNGKNKKLKKKMKKNTKKLKESQDVKDTCVQTETELLKGSPCGSAKPSRARDSDLNLDLDHGESGNATDRPNETVFFPMPYNDDQGSTTDGKGYDADSSGERSLDITGQNMPVGCLSRSVVYEKARGELDGVLQSELSGHEDQPYDPGCISVDNLGGEVEQDRAVESSRGRPDGDGGNQEQADGGWVIVTMATSGQRPEPESPETGDVESVLGGRVESVCLSLESMNDIVAPREQTCGEEDGDNVANNAEEKLTGTDVVPAIRDKSLKEIASTLMIDHAAAADDDDDGDDDDDDDVADVDMTDSCSEPHGHDLNMNGEGQTSNTTVVQAVSYVSNNAVSGASKDGVGVAHADDGDDGNDGNDDVDDDDEVNETEDMTGFVDVFALKKAWRTQNRTLKKQMKKYRERSHHVTRLQQLIGQLEKETAEMKRMLEGLDGQTAALRNEAADMRCTLSAVCDVSVTDLSRTTEARSLEPACYRRYTNIRTPMDAANLLSAVRSRMKALGELEVLVYRKQLVLHHVLPGSAQDRAPGPKRVLRAIHKGPKSKKADDSAAKKGSIVIEVVSPSIESGVATPSWSEEVTNTESPMTTSVPFSVSVEEGTTSPILQVDASDL